MTLNWSDLNNTKRPGQRTGLTLSCLSSGVSRPRNYGTFPLTPKTLYKVEITAYWEAKLNIPFISFMICQFKRLSQVLCLKIKAIFVLGFRDSKSGCATLNCDENFEAFWKKGWWSLTIFRQVCMAALTVFHSRRVHQSPGNTEKLSYQSLLQANQITRRGR